MATNKNNENEEIKNVNNSENENKVQEAPKAVEPKKEKMIKVKIPIDSLNPKDTEVIVGINEKYAKVIRGVETEVSVPVYEQLKNAGLV